MKVFSFILQGSDSQGKAFCSNPGFRYNLYAWAFTLKEAKAISKATPMS